MNMIDPRKRRARTKEEARKQQRRAYTPAEHCYLVEYIRKHGLTDKVHQDLAFHFETTYDAIERSVRKAMFVYNEGGRRKAYIDLIKQFWDWIPTGEKPLTSTELYIMQCCMERKIHVQGHQVDIPKDGIRKMNLYEYMVFFQRKVNVILDAEVTLGYLRKPLQEEYDRLLAESRRKVKEPTVYIVTVFEARWPMSWDYPDEYAALL